VKARPKSWGVDAVLPFPRNRYLQDFAPTHASGGVDLRPEFEAALTQAETIVELPDESDAPAAYQRAGTFMLLQSDLLVAVWDGERKAGPGGTQEIVSHALESGVPVVWIRSDRDEPPALIVGSDRLGNTSRVTATTAAIAGAIASLMTLPPAGAHPSPAGRESTKAAARAPLADFLAEKWRPTCRWVVFDSLKRFPRFWTWRSSIPMRSPSDYRADWSRFLAGQPGDANFSVRLAETLLPRYAWADSLAIYFSHVYRSAYVLTYVLSALAVAVALVDVLPIMPHEGDPHASLTLKAILAAIELAIVGGIILLVRRGRTSRWHERWLDYRALAEMLRHVRFLGLVGGCATLFRRAGEHSRQSSDWILWYVRATCRELGTVAGALDGDYQRRVLRVVESTEIDDQIFYNRANAIALGALDHRLHRFGNGCFYLTAVLLALYLAVFFTVPGIGPVFPDSDGQAAEIIHGLVPWITFLDAFLPALGAAIAGIRFTGDFEGFAERSAETSAALDALKRYYAEAAREPRLQRTSSTLVATASALAEDVSGWQSLYSRKTLVLPA
jgi:hypothetical protein